MRHLAREKGEEWTVDADDPIRGFLRRDGDVTSCAVYEARPFACRAFGVIEEMTCRHFPEDVVTSLPPQKAVLMRLTDPEDQLLGEAFEPGYLERMGAIASGGEFRPGVATQLALQMRAAGALPYRSAALKGA